MGQIDEIISFMEGKEYMTIAEISEETGIPSNDVFNSLREAEIKGLVYRKTEKERDMETERYKL